MFITKYKIKAKYAPSTHRESYTDKSISCSPKRFCSHYTARV